MKNILIAATALTIAFSASTLTANAQADDHGQHVYTQNEASRFAPSGIRSGEDAARDSAERDRINNRIDAYHKAY